MVNANITMRCTAYPVKSKVGVLSSAAKSPHNSFSCKDLSPIFDISPLVFSIGSNTLSRPHLITHTPNSRDGFPLRTQPKAICSFDIEWYPHCLRYSSSK